MDRETKRRLVQERSFNAHRLPEIILERKRLQAEGLALRAEIAVEPARIKAIRQRLAYIKTRTQQLREEHAALLSAAESIKTQLKAAKDSDDQA